MNNSQQKVQNIYGLSLAISPKIPIQNLIGLGGFVGTVTGDVAGLLASTVNSKNG